MSNIKKQLFLWVNTKAFPYPEVFGLPIFEEIELIEIQDLGLALKFLGAHSCSAVLAYDHAESNFFQEVSRLSPQTVQVLIFDDFCYEGKSSLPGAMTFRLGKFFGQASIFRILSLASSREQFLQALQDVQAELKKVMERQILYKESRQKNRELEALNESLEKIVEERTAHIELAKSDEEEKLAKVRALIRFIKDLGATAIFEDLMPVLRRELRKSLKTGDPILIIQTQPDQNMIYSYQNGHFVKSQNSAPLDFVQNFVENSAATGKFLANHFGRPFAKVTALPVEIPLIQKVIQFQGRAVLCLEHSLATKEAGLIFDFFTDRIRPFSLATDRILLEYEHSEIAYRWERTFDSIKDPIAIIDVDYEVLRANKNYVHDGVKKKCYDGFMANEKACEGCPVPMALQSGTHQTGVIQKGGKTFEVHSYPINLDGGRATNVVNHYVDISKSRELYMRMLQSEKMSALGLLAGNIAHELNNPLTGLRSLAQVLIRQVDQKSVVYGDLLEIEKAAGRSQLIIKHLKEFSSKEGAEKSRLSVDEVVQRTMPLLKSIMRMHRIELHVDSQQFLVEMEPQLIQQVIFNLINNACQAMKKPGTLEIGTEYQRQTKRIRFFVRDTGPGIPEEVQKKIFEPFFTTKKEGSGTGLGLSFSKEVIEKHQGRIDFTTQPDEGTEFWFELPVVEELKASQQKDLK